MTASRLETTATISLEKVADGFAITKSHLDLVAKIPDAPDADFRFEQASRRGSRFRSFTAASNLALSAPEFRDESR